ncbi:DUF2115 domain-containing protein [Methanotorris formicicus]|uniref:UPF0305 protein MetfoDRAFT_1117 n=1 Tax=Methanotorris formicicus Mc-S-70 TaxID=647171 RepID=H1KZ94_9EURY|nr:DUF2115 domain-containing protein [Methanotorris formicicus]EHP86248.1 Protein of unknown function DUF2115 [Methanotorris formicicus Mc-S-70]
MDSKELFKKLKKEAREFSIFDMMKARCFMENDAKYLPPQYRNEFLESLGMYFYNILNEIKNKDESSIESYEIDEEKLKRLIGRIESFKKMNSENENAFIRLSKIIAPYLIFIVKKPIHPENLVFPGKKKIIKKGNTYYCPVKSKQKNEYSLCEFCVCRDISELEK